MRWTQQLLVVCGCLGVMLRPPQALAQRTIASPKIHNEGGTVSVRYGDIHIDLGIQSGEISDETIRRVVNQVIERSNREGVNDEFELRRRMKQQLQTLERVARELETLKQQARETDMHVQELGQKIGAQSVMLERLAAIEALKAQIQDLHAKLEQGQVEEVRDSIEHAQDELRMMKEKIRSVEARYALYQELGGIFFVEQPLYELRGNTAFYGGAHWGKEFSTWPCEVSHDCALAWHGAILYRTGEAEGGFTVPLMNAPVFTPVSFSQHGWFVEVGAELRMRRVTGPIQVAIAVDGRVGRVSYVSKGPTKLSYSPWGFAIPVKLNIAFWRKGPVTFSVQGMLIVDFAATRLRYAYTGVGAEVEREDSFVGLHGGGGTYVDVAW